MATKTYTLPYDYDTKRWDTVTVSAQVINQANKEIQKLDPNVLVQDADTSRYPALTNSVLLLENTEIVAEAGSGEVAKLHLRLNDDDARINQILAKNARFKLQVTLRPDLNLAIGKPPKPGPPAKGITEIVVEVPQTWDLTLRKTLWDDAGTIDLNKVDGVDRRALQALGNWGGTLILQPKGQLVDEAGNDKIDAKETIAHARECSIDRGNGEVIKGEWDDARQGYVFEITASQEGDPPSGAPGELTAKPTVQPHDGWQRQLRKLLAAARKIGTGLAPDVPNLARTYVQGCLDHIAVKTEDELTERRRDLNIWILNTSYFVGFMDNATEMFNKGLALFTTASDRMRDNLISFVIEVVFYLFDPIQKLVGSGAGSAKQALKGTTKEMVEEVSEATARELATNKEVLEQNIRGARESIESLNGELKQTGEILEDLGPKIRADPTPAGMQQHGAALAEQTRLLEQQNQLLAQRDAWVQQLQGVNADMAVVQEIKENAAEATEKQFLEKIRERAIAQADNPELSGLIKELEEMSRRDLAQYQALQGQIRETLAEMPEGQARRNLQGLSDAVTKHTDLLRQVDALSKFNANQRDDLLAKGPLGQKLKSVQAQAEQAKKEAEGIRYQNVAWEHYKGLLSPLWWFMDWSIAQIVWLHDLAVKQFPWLGEAENLLILAIDSALGYVNDALNAVLDFMNSHHWRRSCIRGDVRGRGQSTALANGVDGAFFNFPQATAQLAQKLKPRQVVAMGKSGSAAAMKARISEPAKNQQQQEIAAQRSQARRAFASLCRNALDAKRLESAAPDQLTSSTVRGVWRQLARPMVQYEQSFAAAGAQGSDYLWSIGTFAENSTFQDWDGAIEWLGWSLAWGLRLGAILAVFTGVGAVGSVMMFQAADWADRLGPVLRLMVGWLGTMPDIIAFQYDVVIAAALAYEAATEGNVDLDGLVVASEYVE